MPVIETNGLRIGYDALGAGPPAIWLHAAGSLGGEDFAAQVPLFSKAFKVYLPDARGHGRTRWNVATHGFDYASLVDDVLAFADALGVRSFHLLGLSMGAMTALQVASRVPARVRTLAVVGITTEREPRASVGRRLMDTSRTEAADPALAATWARRHDPGQGEGAWRHLMPAIAADIERQPLLTPEDLHRIDAPTLVACGDHDPFVPVGHAWAIARGIPGGQLFVAPGCGHEVPAKRPGLFNEALGGFYRSTEAVARARAEALEGGAP